MRNAHLLLALAQKLNVWLHSSSHSHLLLRLSVWVLLSLMGQRGKRKREPQMVVEGLVL